MIENIQMFKGFVENPVARSLLGGASGFCVRDGKSRLEVALELFSGVREKRDACLRCRLAAKLLNPVLGAGAKAFNVSMDEMRRTFRDPYWRRGLASVVKGLAYFGVRKPFVPGAPFQVVWEVTGVCNLRCKHCSASAGSTAGDLSTGEALDAVEKLADMGVTIIAFSGGEPLIRRDIFQLARAAADHGVYVAMATNGTLITDAVADKLKEAGVEYLQISLDGASPETHDSFRGIPGSFQRTIEGIRRAVERDFFVNISTTVTRLNYREVPRIIELCEGLRVDWFMFYNFIPTGRGRDIVDLDLTPREREELLKTLYERNKESPMKLLSTAPQFARVALQVEGCREAAVIPTHFYNIETKGRIEQLAEFIGGCGAGRFYFAMKPNGDLQPCVFFPLKLGNIKETNLDEMWRKNKVLLELRDKDLLQGHCGECPYRYNCGGCRARAYAYFGDHLAPDPGCINNEEAYLKALESVKEITAVQA
ncbi:MAG: radical SAM protein [Candidatus Bathyarchaeia archaeon]